MRKTLINLTRFGDLLQTQPIIHALKQQGDEVALVCLENFADAAALLDGVEQVAALPGSRLLSGLDEDWRLCAQFLQQWLAGQAETFSPDTVLNLTPTLSARLLSRLMHSTGQPDGFSLDEYGFGHNSSPWGTYVQAASLNRGCSPFNLVDGFRCMTGVEDVEPRYALAEPSPALRAEAETLLAKKCRAAGLSPGKGLVAFQLGASNEARRWPTEHFAALGRLLLEKAGLTPVLLGSRDEKELAQKYFAASGPGIDLSGETDLPHLAATLTACTLLVSNDTGTMHLAAGLGLPVLALFLATAQPWDTGPYREGMCCLEPRLDCHPCAFSTVCPNDGACRQHIRAEDVAELILPWLKQGQWPDMSENSNGAAARARIWLSLRDRHSFMDLQSLSGDEKSDRSAWIRLQRVFYKRFLDSLAKGEQAQTQQPETRAAASNLSPEFRARLLLFLGQADALLLLAQEQARLISLRPNENNRKSLLATCERISRYFDQSQNFVPLAHLWRGMLQGFADNGEQLLSFFQTLKDQLNILSNEITEI